MTDSRLNHHSMKRSRMRLIIAIIVVLISIAAFIYLIDFGPGVKLTLDREDTSQTGKIINPSTQSVNRYSSVLRSLDRLLNIEISADNRFVSFELGAENAADRLFAKNIDVTYLVPLLPYPYSEKLDSFDHANLMLGEFARNGINLSNQASNSLFGYFNSSQNLLDTNADDYSFSDGLIQPNSKAKPQRFTVTNNCLKPGLWEFSASDTVGEMYHSWFKLPKDKYFDMVRAANNFQVSDSELDDAISYRDDLTDVPLNLDKLRTIGKDYLTKEPKLVLDKIIGGYSSQDSRRKVQQQYFQILRKGDVINPLTFRDLQVGDVFRLKKFVAPGIYSGSDYEYIKFNPLWSKVSIREVLPLTQYPAGKTKHDDLGYVEIALYEQNQSRAIFLGNLPISLLVEQEDYRIPAFGVGVFPPSQLIERRFLRVKEGPAPHYAYLTEYSQTDKNWMLVNNHETGIEQVYIRPFRRGEQLLLRITLIAYERIVDLLELEVPIEGPLAEKIKTATALYKPPLYRVYEDANTL